MKNLLHLYYQIIQENTIDGGLAMRETRSGKVISSFGKALEWDLRNGFPAVTTKKLAFKSVIGELLWFLSGKTDLKTLRQYSNIDEGAWTIWTQDFERWAKSQEALEDFVDNEDLGEIYGAQWRNWDTDGIDQITNLIEGLKNAPTSRYHMVSAWNVAAIDAGDMALPPCHFAFQCFVGLDPYTDEPRYLDLMWHQRSVDSFLGLPFNIASYAALLQILGKLTGLQPRMLKCTLGDVHIYEQHIPQILEQLGRKPHMLPRMAMPTFSSLDELLTKTAQDFRLIDYGHHLELKGKLTVGDEDEGKSGTD